MNQVIKSIVDKYCYDPARLMDILLDVQEALGYIPEYSISQISRLLCIPSVNVLQTVSFYHFFATEPRGKYTVFLNNCVVAGFHGRENVRKAFENAAGIEFGHITSDGLIGLSETACIGMSDQEPSAIINDRIFTKLTSEKAEMLVKGMRAGISVDDLVKQMTPPDSVPSMKNTMVEDNIRMKGAVVFSDYVPGLSLGSTIRRHPSEIIDIMKHAMLRGRGGAGFLTGTKWEIAREVWSDVKYIFCNADEGEPGTFKDRVILSKLPKLVFEGMAIAGYSVGSTSGILYLRNEYRYMREFLEETLEEMRAGNLLGKKICGKSGFDFDIRIQFGAGSYVCGEESALIESAEGKRGEPRDKPPYPVEKGYLQKPTVVNNVETFVSVARIVQFGAKWYNQMGTDNSKGTKVLSISGDCRKPGIYEIEWGFSVNDIIKLAEAGDVQAVQVGGPSGTCIGPDEFGRILAYEDLSTGGSLIIIGGGRDLLRDVVLNFQRFFADESCGSCVPCRALTDACARFMERLLSGKAGKKDLESVLSWPSIMKNNRCGLGQSALNPFLTTYKNFRKLYEQELVPDDEGLNPGFDLKSAVSEYESITRKGTET